MSANPVVITSTRSEGNIEPTKYWLLSAGVIVCSPGGFEFMNSLDDDTAATTFLRERGYRDLGLIRSTNVWGPSNINDFEINTFARTREGHFDASDTTSLSSIAAAAVATTPIIGSALGDLIFEPLADDYGYPSGVVRVLGPIGISVLERLRRTIDEVASELDWPLAGVDLRIYQDPEIDDWEYVVVSPLFDCPFEQADAYLQILFGQFDGLSAKMSEGEQQILSEKISFGVESSTSVPAS